MFCLNSKIGELAIFTLKKMANGRIFNRDSKIFYKYGTKNWDYATSETLNYQNARFSKTLY